MRFLKKVSLDTKVQDLNCQINLNVGDVLPKAQPDNKKEVFM